MARARTQTHTHERPCRPCNPQAHACQHQCAGTVVTTASTHAPHPSWPAGLGTHSHRIQCECSCVVDCRVRAVPRSLPSLFTHAAWRRRRAQSCYSALSAKLSHQETEGSHIRGTAARPPSCAAPLPDDREGTPPWGAARVRTSRLFHRRLHDQASTAACCSAQPPQRWRAPAAPDAASFRRGEQQFSRFRVVDVLNSRKLLW